MEDPKDNVLTLIRQSGYDKDTMQKKERKGSLFSYAFLQLGWKIPSLTGSELLFPSMWKDNPTGRAIYYIILCEHAKNKSVQTVPGILCLCISSVSKYGSNSVLRLREK